MCSQGSCCYAQQCHCPWFWSCCGPQANTAWSQHRIPDSPWLWPCIYNGARGEGLTKRPSHLYGFLGTPTVRLQTTARAPKGCAESPLQWAFDTITEALWSTLNFHVVQHFLDVWLPLCKGRSVDALLEQGHLGMYEWLRVTAAAATAAAALCNAPTTTSTPGSSHRSRLRLSWIEHPQDTLCTLQCTDILYRYLTSPVESHNEHTHTHTDTCTHIFPQGSPANSTGLSVGLATKRSWDRSPDRACLE